MISTRVGDLAQHLTLRRANTDLKTTLDQLSAELASGRTADPLTRLGGDLGPLSAIESSMRLNAAWADSRNEASGFASAQQSALEYAQNLTTPVGMALLEASSSADATRLRATLDDTAERFSIFVSTLNSSFAGRSLFSGAATQTVALADADTIRTELGAAVAGAISAADVLAAAEDFFLSAGGGFETLIYQGSADPLAGFALDETTKVSLEVTAADPALREGMMRLGLGALMKDGLLESYPEERKALLEMLGNGLIQSVADVVELRAGVGHAEARIEESQARGAAADAALEMARAALVGIDPYDTATRLEQARVQLETVYTLTARLSGLSLAQVLR
jgi:flagellar hook-associated protein 3 FlgL